MVSQYSSDTGGKNTGVNLLNKCMIFPFLFFFLHRGPNLCCTQWVGEALLFTAGF